MIEQGLEIFFWYIVSLLVTTNFKFRQRRSSNVDENLIKSNESNFDSTRSIQSRPVEPSKELIIFYHVNETFETIASTDE